ncbi:MAG: hypothetical protein ACR2LN_00670 [Candidatus Levyibacteriota bacterium]
MVQLLGWRGVFMSVEQGRVIPISERRRNSFSIASFPADGNVALQPDVISSPTFPRMLTPIDGPPTESLRDKLARARDIFVADESKKEKKVKAYEVEQDAVLYRVLAQERGRQEYFEAKKDLDSYMQIQLETHLGERLHVGISRFTHSIVDGELRAEGTDESLLRMLERGRDYRREHGEPVDWDREESEVHGFAHIQDVLADPKTPIGTMMFFVSPPGSKASIYKNNFYDVHQKVSDTEAVSYRYTSGLTAWESQQRLKLLDPRYDRDDALTDAEFIGMPIRIERRSKLSSPDAIHDFMHVDHKHMSKENFAVVRQACRPLMEDYLDSLTNDPDNIAEHKKRLDILMNYGDNVSEELLKAPVGRVAAFPSDMPEVRPWFPPVIDKSALARQKVRLVETGCGDSGGTSELPSGGPSSPFSVAEAALQKTYSGENAKDDPGLCRCEGKKAHFHCPGTGTECGHAIIVGEGTTNCPNCGAGKNC